jgi:hypothetical protein
MIKTFVKRTKCKAGKASLWLITTTPIHSTIGYIWISKVYLYSCTHLLRSRNSPRPPPLGTYMRALLVSQDRQHLFVTPSTVHISCKSTDDNKAWHPSLENSEVYICLGRSSWMVRILAWLPFDASS